MSDFESVSSSVKTPADFVKDKTLFSIPCYQRPYVWSDEAIKELFDDLHSAYTHKLPYYYVGTILTAQSDDDTLELIDGQQRTTTLMLLALACKKKGIETDLTQLICTEKENQPLRLVFKIRDQVEAYLGNIAGLAEYNNNFPSETEVEKNPYLKRLAGGLATFENLLGQISEQSAFTNYVYKNMRMVNNVIPPSTDLNQLFATMNNSGVQLEQADILKSLLFKSIRTNKAIYSAIWQACENMDNYFERNVRQVFPKTQWSELDPIHFAKFDTTKFLLIQDESNGTGEIDSENRNNGLTIAEIIRQQTKLKDNCDSKDSNISDDEKSEVYCTSIISFSQLLLHVYRIYLHKNEKDDFEPRFHADQLINTFKPLIDEGKEECIKEFDKGNKECTKEFDEEKKKCIKEFIECLWQVRYAFKEKCIKEFIECLWQVRYVFDVKVVKWVKKVDEDEEQLILCSINKSSSNDNYYFNRSPSEHSNLSLLQMVRYFTSDRNAQYWLTPYLAWLVKEGDKQALSKLENLDNQALTKLESLDNQLSLANTEQKPASYALLSRNLSKKTEEIKDAHNYLNEYLNESNGVNFRHYWFQKLEYLLYKDLSNIDNKKLKQYRIISRNSVEHVHPQHEENGKQLKNEDLNSFGNLALLNISQNSAYSNQAVKKKKIDFEAKPTFDSLKLKHIFDLMQGGSWDISKITKHQELMIDLLIGHYKNTNNEGEMVSQTNE